jgi:hypothetical protein
MRSCAQGVRGMVIALQPVMAFCHKKLGLLNKRVSTQCSPQKLKARGKRQDLTPSAPRHLFKTTWLSFAVSEGFASLCQAYYERQCIKKCEEEKLCKEGK